MTMNTVLVAVLFFTTWALGEVNQDVGRNPVILVPGHASSQLEGKLNKTSIYNDCPNKTSNYITLWLSVMDLMPSSIHCLVENLKLWYDPVTHTTSNTPGVDIRVRDFGKVSSVEYLGNDNNIPVMKSTIDYLVSIGYTRDVTLRGAPYDFRKAPNELGDYFVQLKQLIEETYTQNNNTKVVVIAHSMGNPVFVYFLNRQSQTWKDKYMQAYISLAGVWGGSVLSIELMTSGSNYGYDVIDHLVAREQQRTMPSTAFLMPHQPFWNSTDILVYTSDKNYSISNYEQFFKDINYITGYLMRKDTENILRDLEPPQVPFHCIHGSNISTPAALIFGKGEFPDGQPTGYIQGDGDGVVNLQSLLGCTRWIGQQKEPINHTVFAGNDTSHENIKNNVKVNIYIRDVVTFNKSPTTPRISDPTIPILNGSVQTSTTPKNLAPKLTTNFWVQLLSLVTTEGVYLLWFGLSQKFQSL